MTTEQPDSTFGVLAGNDAMNMLIDIYMDGFVSGAASAAVTLLSMGRQPNANDEQIGEQLSQKAADAIRADPLAVECVRNEITERLAGIDSAPKGFSLPNVPEAEQ